MPYTVETAVDYIIDMRKGEVAKNVIVGLATCADILAELKRRHLRVNVDVTQNSDGSFNFYRH